MVSKTVKARSFLGRALIFLAIAALVFSVFQAISASAEERFLSRRNLLRTSYDPDNYTLFQIDGDTIYARGRYADDRIKRVTVPGHDDDISSYKFSVEEDGSYEAEITCSTTYELERIRVELTSGMAMEYTMYYDDGWFFPDTGVIESNRKVFDNITDASPKSVGYYMSATADAHEIEVVKEQIKLISDSVVEGIEDDYEKARAINEYVAEHFYYDHDARVHSVSEANVVLAEVLKTCRTVCTGFADLYCALLQAQGIDAVNIIGGSTGGGVDQYTLADGLQNHEFAAFYYEKEQRWVWVDSCWSGSGDYINGEFFDKNYHIEFFDISDEALAIEHRADYAQRRDFFGAEASDPIVSAETTEETTVVTIPPQLDPKVTTTKAVETEAAKQNVPKAAERDRELYVIAGVLAAAVIGAAFAVFRNLRKKP